MVVQDRARAGPAMNLSQGDYRAIFDAVSDAILIHDGATGEILEVNRGMCEMFGYTPEEARSEAGRCLRCDACIRCGACERVCRDAMQVHALKFTQISPAERLLSDYQRAGERCIACGACAQACPTGAIDYVEGPDRREVRLCGTILNRLETPRCQGCGGSLPPARYLDYVTAHSDAVMGKQVQRRLCPHCAREKRAAAFVKLS